MLEENDHVGPFERPLLSLWCSLNPKSRQRPSTLTLNKLKPTQPLDRKVGTVNHKRLPPLQEDDEVLNYFWLLVVWESIKRCALITSVWVQPALRGGSGGATLHERHVASLKNTHVCFSLFEFRVAPSRAPHPQTYLHDLCSQALEARDLNWGLGAQRGVVHRRAPTRAQVQSGERKENQFQLVMKADHQSLSCRKGSSSSRRSAACSPSTWRTDQTGRRRDGWWTWKADKVPSPSTQVCGAHS